MRTTARAVVKTAISILGVVVGYSLFLCFPQPLFCCFVSDNNLSLYSDRAFSRKDGIRILRLVQGKLALSPIYSSTDRHAIFVCNSGWRRAIFFPLHRAAGGINYYPFTSNVFLSGALMENNRLVSPSGQPDVFGRTLDHFIAHEITHTLTVKAVGWCRYRVLPDWIKEGYAEYVGNGRDTDYDEAVRAFRENTPEMNFPPRAPYLRYRLLVSFLLEKKNLSPSRLFKSAIRQTAVEAMLRDTTEPAGVAGENQRKE